MCTHKSILLDYKYLNNQIRQKHVRLDVNRVQSDRASMDNYGNGNIRIKDDRLYLFSFLFAFLFLFIFFLIWNLELMLV